jgi:DnaA-homolog protein
MQQIPLPIAVPGAPGFVDFIPGDNAQALHHVAALAAGLADPAVGAQRRFSVTYLWGAPGAGKSHLLGAAAAELQAAGARVRWAGPGAALPWPAMPEAPLLLIDDCDRLDDAGQQAAFAALLEAQCESIAVLAAGRLPPVDLPLREDLRSRLGWGHVFALQALSEAQVRASLRQAADRRGIFLGDEVMDFLLTRFPRDLSTLSALLDRIDRYSMAQKRQVTLPLVRRMLADESGASA